ncbi:DUF3656 domain-containing U32 family peptidase [Candidatus Formimonas warabiya]|uniref:DUF3656 domain-containing U32 family peptidase n=1 Tax=Formimonas warabiya TaxID=1761012 RepID=UPI001BE4B1BA|nr:U32 family peptidase [Candidatus Formimonas warabiya]
MRIPEILAPAGDFDALVAAVENGADAVYLGGKTFSARAFAGNFDDMEMEKAIKYAHLRSIRIYVTVNILIDNSEMKDVMNYLKRLYDWGVDAVIIQDLGLGFLLGRLLPELNVHGSTQMTVHNAEGAQFLSQMGMDRVVLAREVALDDVPSIKQETAMDLEIFGHGALCISYSGQCLMSSLIGGRSGNRGKCAQPCRMTYALVDEKGRFVGDQEMGNHLLSPRDLNTLELLPLICETGICSLKFEGRMKRPEYVATVIRIYRQALDRFKADPKAFQVFPEELHQLAQIFNRDFTQGHLLGNPGRDLMSYKRPNNRGVRLGRVEEVKEREQLALIKLDEEIRVGDGVEIWVTKGGRQGFFVDKIYHGGVQVKEAGKGETVFINIIGKPKVGDRVFKTHDIRLMDEARTSYLQPRKLIPLHMKISALEGRPIILKGWDDQGNEAAYTSPYLVEKAKKHAADEESVAQQLNRLGGTGFTTGALSFDLEEGMMLPASELNTARRYLVDHITKQRLEKYRYPTVSREEFDKKLKVWIGSRKTNQKGKVLNIAARVAGMEEARAALEAGADVIYLGGETFRSQGSCSLDQMQKMGEFSAQNGREIVCDLPNIFHEKERKQIYHLLDQAAQGKWSGLLVGNVGGISAAKNAGWGKKLYGDIGLNVFNDATIQYLSQNGMSRVTLSLELTFGQIEKLNPGAMEMECVVHGALPMMVSQYCAVGAVLGEKSRENSCTRPCLHRSFGLKDRMNYVFPLEMDQFCRMHAFNPQELCLIEHLDKFFQLGVHWIRIEAKRYRPEAVYQVINTYRRVKEAVLSHTVNQLDLNEMADALKKTSGAAGFTKGHYFRGVL